MKLLKYGRKVILVLCETILKEIHQWLMQLIFQAKTPLSMSLSA